MSAVRSLRQKIESRIRKHGGLRAAAKAMDMDPSYLLRLMTGEKTNPSRKTLAKLGLVRVENYRRL